MTREEFLDKEHAFVCGTDTDVVRFYHTTIMKIFEDMKTDTNFWKDLCQDMVEVLGNDPYMVATAMKGWVKKMADTEDEKRLLDLVNDIENRLLSVKPHEWNE